MKKNFKYDYFKICYLHTKFQKIIFKSILQEKKLDESSFLIIGHENLHDGFTNFLTLKEYYSPITFQRARAIIKELDSIVSKEKKFFELWIGSDDNAISQVLTTNRKCKDVILFEDGIGSYLQYNTKEYIFTKNFLIKIKNFIAFYPRFWAFKNVGSNIKAKEYYALNKLAFPSNKNSLKNVLNVISAESYESIITPKDIPEINHNKSSTIALIIDQPFVDCGFTSCENYSNLINEILIDIKTINKRLDFAFIMKFHPGTKHSTKENIKKIVNQFNLNVHFIDDKYTSDEWILMNKKNIKLIVGFTSTVLLHAKILHPNIPVYFKNPLLGDNNFPSYKNIEKVFEDAGIKKLVNFSVN